MKVIIKEEQKKGLVQTLINFLDKHGVLNTINFIGGYDNFINILPDYFDSTANKIKLITDLVNNDEYERIYLHELGSSVKYDNGGDDLYVVLGDKEGHTFESYMESVGKYMNDNRIWVTVKVWEYDEDGNMFDEYSNEFDILLVKMDTKNLNKLFDVLVDYFFQ